MPPRYLRKASTTPLKPCAEFTVETCDTAPADQCCGALPCKLCLEWETYEDGIFYGSATFAGSSWTGTVGGHSFVSYWERNYETGECEYIVTLDDEEVYRAACYNGASCRNPAGDVAVSTAYNEGTLRWSKFDPRELALMVDPDTGCRDFFCGNCRCSCNVLCVDVNEVIYPGISENYSGELQDVSYSDCDAPVWAGAVGNFDISLALGRDAYGNCVVTPTVNGNEGEPVAVTGCSDMSGTIELEDGSTITFRCKQCDCAAMIGDCICGRPLGPTLRLLWSSGNGTHGSASREFLLSYGMINEPTIDCAPWSPGAFPGYRGSVSGTFPLPMGGTRQDTLEVILVCECIRCEYCIYYRWVNDDTPDEWFQTSFVVTSCDCPAILDENGGGFNEGTTAGYQVSAVTIYELESNC
jgi:hypothetical protein